MEEVVQGQTTEVTQTQAETTSPEPQVQSASSQAGAEAAAQEAVEQQWQLNPKLKAYDKEYEIPEEFRGLFNKDNYDKLKDVFERHFAFDTIKDKYKSANEKFTEVSGKYETISKNLDRLSKFVQNGDFDSFFNSIKIPEEAIQKWIYNKIQMRDLPPEQQSLYTKNSEYQRQMMTLQEQYEEMQNKLQSMEQAKQEQVIQQRHSELDSTIGSPDYKSLAESYDARVGKPGAFKEEVILRAAAVANATGKDLSVKEAVAEFAKLVAWNNQNSGQQAVAAKTGNSRPTIPSVSGKASSPVAPQVKSIDDLKKLSKAAQQSV